jgi:hypothetical protein
MRKKGRTSSKGVLFRLGLLSFLLAAPLALAEPQGEKGESWLQHGRRALEQHRAKNYPAFLEHAEKAVRAGPARHPWLMFHLARAYSLNDRTAEASRLLGELAGMGLGVEAGGEDFKPLHAAAGWAALNERLKAARASPRPAATGSTSTAGASSPCRTRTPRPNAWSDCS